MKAAFSVLIQMTLKKLRKVVPVTQKKPVLNCFLFYLQERLIIKE